jgi:hypothetical protein
VAEPATDSCFATTKHNYLNDVCHLLNGFTEPIINFKPTGPAEYIAKPFKILDGNDVIPAWPQRIIYAGCSNIVCDDYRSADTMLMNKKETYGLHKAVFAQFNIQVAVAAISVSQKRQSDKRAADIKN